MKAVGKALLIILLTMGEADSAEIIQADLPPLAQVEHALDEYLQVKNAINTLKMEQANQKKWNSGNYEFNLRAGSAQRNIVGTGQNLKEWDVELERPLRLYNKVGIDENIGAASVAKAEFALGDARHETARMLLKLWFEWQRAADQAALWHRQADNLVQQAAIAEKRLKAGDASRLELNQAKSVAAQAGVSGKQAELRAQLAGNAIENAFPEILLPDQPVLATPVPVEHDLSYWKSQILDDNHELGMAEQQSRVAQLMADRSRADRVPDPTVGLRHSSEFGGTEIVNGIYFSVPLSFGLRSAQAESVAQQAEISADQASFVRRRLEGDIYTAYTGAVKNYESWQLAYQAAQSMQNNAQLSARAYQLGETSLNDNLIAQRNALESSISESQARLDANESRYRLLLDAHRLWPLEGHETGHK